MAPLTEDNSPGVINRHGNVERSTSPCVQRFHGPGAARCCLRLHLPPEICHRNTAGTSPPPAPPYGTKGRIERLQHHWELSEEIRLESLKPGSESCSRFCRRRGHIRPASLASRVFRLAPPEGAVSTDGSSQQIPDIPRALVPDKHGLCESPAARSARTRPRSPRQEGGSRITMNSK